jgi:hypothetical protein
MSSEETTSTFKPQDLHDRAAGAAKETRSTIINLTTIAVGALFYIATREFTPALTRWDKRFVVATLFLMVASLATAIWFGFSDAQWSYHRGIELATSDKTTAHEKAKYWHVHKAWSEILMLIFFVAGSVSAGFFVGFRIFGVH